MELRQTGRSLLNWFEGVPQSIKLSAFVASSLVSMFAGALPESWQSTGLWAGLAFACVTFLGLLLHAARGRVEGTKHEIDTLSPLQIDLARHVDGFRPGATGWRKDTGFNSQVFIGVTNKSSRTVDNVQVRVMAHQSRIDRPPSKESTEVAPYDRSKPVSLNPGDRAEYPLAIHFNGRCPNGKVLDCVGVGEYYMRKGLTKLWVRISARDLPAVDANLALKFEGGVEIDFWREGEHELCHAENT